MERKRNEMKKSSILLAAIMVLSVFAVAMPTNVAAKEVIFVDEFFDVHVDESVYIGFHAPEGVEINVDIITDHVVDIMLMSYTNLLDYKAVLDFGGIFHYYVDGSALNSKGITYTFVIPKTGRYYIVVDNTHVPIGGAYTGVRAMGHVRVAFTPTPTPTPTPTQATPTPVIVTAPPVNAEISEELIQFKMTVGEFDINGDGELDLYEAESFFYWVEQNIKYRYDDENDPDGLRYFEAGRITAAQLGDGREGIDYWQAPWETLNEGYGDCEDMAILQAAFYDSFGIEAYVGLVNAKGYKIDHAICIVRVGETPEEFDEIVNYYLGGYVVYYYLEGGHFMIVDNAYSEQFGFITAELTDEKFTLIERGTWQEKLRRYEEIPGFGAVFAIVGPFAVAYVLRKRK